MSKARKKVTISGEKSAANVVLKYRKLRARGEVAELPALETLSKFFTRKGTVKKRETRYDTGRALFNAARSAALTALGSKSAGEKNIIAYDKAEKARKRLEKASKTYADKNIPDNRFKRVARQKMSKYMQMVDIFASETYNRLRDGGYGLASGVVEALVDELNARDLTTDDIIKYLEQIESTLDDIPPKARRFATQDDFWRSVVELSDTLASDDTGLARDVFNVYLTTDYSRDELSQAAQNFAELNNNTLTFVQAWEKLQHTSDPSNYDNLYEILEEEKEKRAAK